jgi:hypothetical protein
MRFRWLAFSRFLLGVAVVFAANFLAGALTPQSDSLRRFDLFYRPLLLVFLLAGFGILILHLDRVPGNPLAAMGLARRPPWLRDLWVGSLLGSGTVALAVAVIAIFGTLTIRVALTARTVQLAAAVIVVLITGAAAEEVSFRGYPFQRLIEAIGARLAVVVSSALFGAVHLLNPHASLWGFLNTVLVGVLLALAYLRTRSLWMPIAIHFAWNATLGLVFGLPVSGLTEFSVITRARTGGPLWLTGGDYGIEASLMGAAAIVLGIGLLLLFVPSRAMPQVPEASTPVMYGAGELVSGNSSQLQLPLPSEKSSQEASPASSESMVPRNPDNPSTG